MTGGPLIPPPTPPKEIDKARLDVETFGSCAMLDGKHIPLKEFYMPKPKPPPAHDVDPEVLKRLAAMSDSDKALAMVYADARVANAVGVETRRCIAIVSKAKKARAKDFRAIIDEMRNAR